MSTTPNESGISQTGAAGFHLVGKGSNKKWHIKMLVSLGAIFICLLLITAATESHFSQKYHFGWLNYDYNRKGPSTELGEIVEPAEVVTQPPAEALRSKRSEPSDACLECIALSTSETEQRGNIRVMCGTSPCGNFRIWPTYWADAVLALPAAFASLSYESCVSSSECSKALVRGYIKLHARDCNQDGVISCRDHIMLHQVGPTECQTRRLQIEIKERINRCLRLKELE